MSRTELRPFGVATAHTEAVIRLVPGTNTQLWDLRPLAHMKSLREQLAHLALVRESIICTLTGREPKDLKTIFNSEPWVGPGGTDELLRAWEEHTRRCQIMLADLQTADLTKPFQTEFGSVSTPENYLRMMLLEETHHRAQMMLLEETHHRAQMILMLRMFRLDAPEFPGRAWSELNL